MAWTSASCLNLDIGDLHRGTRSARVVSSANFLSFRLQVPIAYPELTRPRDATLLKQWQEGARRSCSSVPSPEVEAARPRAIVSRKRHRRPTVSAGRQVSVIQ